MSHVPSAPRHRVDDRRLPHGSVVFALLAALALLLGACSTSGSDDASDETTTTEDGAASSTTDGSTATTEDGGSTSGDDDLVATLADGLESGLQVTDRDTAECIAAGWIDIIGVDRITEADADPAALGDGDSSEWALLDLSESEAGDLYDVVGECDHDLAQAFADQLDGQGLTEEQTSCVLDALDDAAVEDLLVQTFLGEDGSDSALVQDLTACESPSGG